MSHTPNTLPETTGSAPSTRRRDAALHLLHRDQLKESMSLSRQPFLRNSTLAGLQAAITSVIALPLTYLSPWSHLIGFAALGTLVALLGRFAPGKKRHLTLFQAGLCQVLVVLIMSSAAWLGAPELLELSLLALLCGVLLFICVTGNFGPPGALIFIFAAGASMTTEISLEQVVQRTLMTAVVAVLAWAVCALTEPLRQLPGPESNFPEEPQRPLTHRLIAAARISVGAGFAIFIASYALEANYPAWAAMGALAIMQGTHLHISMNRALQRMAGTVAGAVLAWILLQQAPSIWFLILIVAVLQLLTEFVIGFNYALGLLFVTPMALLMTYLGANGNVGMEIVTERLLDTLLGAGIGIAVAVLLSTLDDRRYLAKLRQPPALDNRKS
ncbi:FUSC family protein [Marinobacterium maritimum]|uniref:FUSC family protein n=1 Tax=Marinobacterium maritimum TaxID=500162 RepID=A0ABP3TCA4_9GAMM